MNNLNFLKNQLDNSINELLLNYHPFLTDGGNHFSRNRKIPLKTLIEYILFMGSNALKDELYDLSNFNDTPSVSAFVQQRRKISADAFRFLFDSFNKRTYSPQNGLFIGYRLLAVDGSSVPISHNPKDEDTYIKQISKGGLSGKGHNAFHLNAMYDLLDHTYTDAVIQGEAHMNENDAFNTMILRYNGAKAIFIADRGFESLNSFVYVMKKHQKFLIRVKDIHSNGLHLLFLNRNPVNLILIISLSLLQNRQMKSKVVKIYINLCLQLLDLTILKRIIPIILSICVLSE